MGNMIEKEGQSPQTTLKEGFASLTVQGDGKTK